MTTSFQFGGLLLLTVVLSGCAGMGPTALSAGRLAYNEVLNQTEDQQILSMIVRHRYDETFGMLAVSSVTASLHFGANVGGNAGVGPRSGYEGNLVPLSAGAMYEENPTISYVPLRGEQFVERMLAPVSAEQALLLGRMSTDDVEVLRFVVRRANGLVNPLYSSRPVASGSGGDFDRFVDLYGRLRELGMLDIVRTADDQFAILFHDYSEADAEDVGELLRLLGVQRRHTAQEPIQVPLRFFVGSSRPDSIDLETPSALEVIEAAGFGIDVPSLHISEGVARPSRETGRRPLVSIHTSPYRPPRRICCDHAQGLVVLCGRT